MKTNENRSKAISLKVEPTAFATAIDIIGNRPTEQPKIVYALYHLWLDRCLETGTYIDPVDMLPIAPSTGTIAESTPEYGTTLTTATNQQIINELNRRLNNPQPTYTPRGAPKKKPSKKK